LLLLKLLAHHLFWRADVIFINSIYCRNQLLRYLPQYHKKLFVNYVGLEPIPLPSSTTPSWAKDLIAGKAFILFAGSISDNKNQRRLIHAWGELQQDYSDLPTLVLIGPYDHVYKHSILDSSIRTMPRPDEIIITGHVSEDELVWAYYNAHSYIQPSIAEGCSSFSVFQAMSCGLPVACANTTSHPEGVGDAALLFDPFDVRSIMGATLRIWRDTELRNELIAKGYRHVSGRTWRKNAEETCRHILRLLKC
jgi:glycosyltransferase involved in cell wall biosynthesis